MEKDEDGKLLRNQSFEHFAAIFQGRIRTSMSAVIPILLFLLSLFVNVKRRVENQRHFRRSNRFCSLVGGTRILPMDEEATQRVDRVVLHGTSFSKNSISSCWVTAWICVFPE